MGLLLLAGVGGERFESAHIEDTAEFLETLPLDGRDRVFFSRVAMCAVRDLLERAQEEGLIALGDEETRAQFRIFKRLYERHGGERGPAVHLFDQPEALY